MVQSSRRLLIPGKTNRVARATNKSGLLTASLAIFFMLASLTEAGGLDSKKAMYVGTVASVKERSEGVPLTTDEKIFVFTFRDDDKESKLTVPCDRINDLE